ncbi:MAG: FliM/FliN family flagellar motor switch protein [Sedimentisphaerales bacterium]|nr:FliM/FliN family flagellar motor switch protein [Sedimentisphaerales bacterium]
MTDAPVHNLSRAKIQRLLTAVGSVSAETEALPEVAEYNWRDPHYFNEDERNRLAAVMSQGAALLSEKFVHFYGTESNVEPVAITQSFAGDLADHIELSHSFWLPFGPDTRHPCGFLTVDAQTALSWVTLLLGDSEAENDPDRTLSALEESLLSDLVLAIAEAFISALRPHLELTHGANVARGMPTVSFESTDEVCIIVFEVKRADANEASQIRFVFPCRVLAPLVGKRSESAAQPTQEEIKRVMLEHLQEMPVTITAKLSSTWLSFEEVLDLGQGDIVLLDKHIDEPLDLVIDDQPIFRARPTQSGGRYAALIAECTAGTAPQPTRSPAAK